MLIAEKLLLLGLRQDKGTVVAASQTALNFGLAGAILMELSMMGRFELQKDRVVVTNPAGVSDPILYDAMLSIVKANKPKKLQHWVTRLGNNRLHTKLANRLVERGILKKEKKHFLGIFPYTTHPEVNATPEQEIRKQIRSVVLDETEPNEEQLILLSLVKACSLVNEIFLKEERKAAKKRIDNLVKGQAVEKAVSAATAAVNAAIYSSVAAASIAASSSNSSGT